MLSEGTAAPLFELPALVDGAHRRVSLSDYLGEDVVILAFYPADFNPACDDTSCDLDELDLFTMQKDVTILGISPDTVYSHRAFADRYDLKVPLLSDTDHDVAREYGIDFVDDIGQQLIERAVVVIDHDGEVQYVWCTEDMRELPRVEEIKDAIADTGGDDTAFARYRVGHAHYTEGRRAFTAAMGGFRDSEWMVAQGDFQQAREEFEEAADHFDTAVRFVDDESVKPIYEGAKTKANSLWQASDWLAQAARAYSSGSGAKGQDLRDDAERPLETARGYEEPPDPDDPWPPDVETLEKDTDDDSPAFLPQDEEDIDTSLDVDIDEEVEHANSELAESDSAGSDAAPDSTQTPEAADAADEMQAAGDGTTAPADPADGSAEAEADSETTPAATTDQQGPRDEPPSNGEQTAAAADGPDAGESETVSPPDGEGELSEVDDADIEEIQAELAASEAENEPTGSLEENPTAMVEAPPDTVGDADDDSPTADAPSDDGPATASSTATDPAADADAPATADDEGDSGTDATYSTASSDADQPNTEAGGDVDSAGPESRTATTEAADTGDPTETDAGASVELDLTDPVAAESDESDLPKASDDAGDSAAPATDSESAADAERDGETPDDTDPDT